MTWRCSSRADRHPYDDLSALTGSVSNYFAQMVVVGALELVLDDRFAPGIGFLCVYFDVERTRRRLGLYESELNVMARLDSPESRLVKLRAS